MTSRIRPIGSIIAGLLLLVASAAAGQGRAEGEIRYDGRAVAIAHASAREVVTPGDWTADNQAGRSIKVLLTDRVPSAAAAAGESGFMEAADAGELNGLVVRISLPDHLWSTLAISRPGGREGTLASGGLGPPQYELSDLVLRDGTVSGRVRTLEPQEFFPPDDSGAAAAFAFDIRFTAPVAPAPRPVQTLTGDAARRSPQADAAVAFNALLLSGDLARIRAGLDPRTPLASQLPADDGEARAMLEQMGEFVMAPDQLRAAIQRVEIHDGYAFVVARDDDGGTILAVEPDNGGWRVGRPRRADD